MIWLMISLIVLICEYNGGDRWLINSVRNLVITAVIIILFKKHPVEIFMTGIIVFCAFTGFVLYEKSTSGNACKNGNPPQKIRRIS